jgi:hypothetical protein
VLGQYVANLACAIDCDRLAVGDGLTAATARIVPRLQGALGAAVPFPPRVVVARFPFEAPLMGAQVIADAAAPRY